jgi:hypothetical protein
MLVDEWGKEQLKPMGMQELAKWWTDCLKVVGSANGAGVLALGTALHSFGAKAHLVSNLKAGALVFFVGLMAFGFAFLSVSVAALAFDEYVREIMKGVDEGNPNRILQSEPAKLLNSTTISAMRVSYWFAGASMLAFFIGSAIGAIALLRL